MTPGKLEWRDLESFVHHNRLRSARKHVVSEEESFSKYTLGRKLLNSGLSRHRLLLDMLRGFMTMDVMEKERRDVPTDQPESQDTSSSSFSDGGPALVQCVERFFKNPQQNYEVPLQLLQEWFSDTSTLRRQELAKLFLALLQEQGLDMNKIMGHVLDYSDNCKSSGGFLEGGENDSKKELTQVESDSRMEGEDLRGQSIEMRDEDSSSVKAMQWVDSNNSATSSLNSDPVILKTLREYRPMPVKPKSDNFLATATQKEELMKDVNVDVPTSSEEREEMMMPVVGEEGCHRRTEGFNDICHSIAHCGDYYSGSELDISSSYSSVEKEKTTRSVGTSPFQEASLTTKYSSESNIRRVCSEVALDDKRTEVRGLRKSQSLPSVRCLDPQAPIPPLIPIEFPRKKCYASKETSTMRTTDYSRHDYSRQVENKSTVVSNVMPTPTTYKARTTFVEMSHAEFMKRQMLLNEKVSVRQGFRLGNQILYVPELISCSAPHVEKPGPPLLVHSNVDLKRSRNPVEIKLAMMASSEVLENVMVSQTSSSHTIHYTPSQNHSVSATSNPTQLINDKCSLLYVRESIPHAPPLVATAPTTTWQEEAKKKPIIAYSKRKPSETREKQNASFGDSMKVFIAPNGILSSVHELPNKVMNHCKPAEKDVSSGVVNSISNAPSLPEMGAVTTVTSSGPVPVTSTINDMGFVKSTPEEPRDPVPLAPTEVEPTKPTLPKFNQTFVQNFQMKSSRTTDPMTESQTIDYLENVPKKVVTPFSPISQVDAETVTEGNRPVTQDSSVMTDDQVSVTHTQSQPKSGVIHSAFTAAATPVLVERSVQVKTMSNAPPTQLGLLIYTQGSPEESCPIQTLLLTTLPNGSAYCVRLPPNTNLHNVSTPAASPQVEATARPVGQAVQHGTSVSVKQTNTKPDSIPVAPPAESNKVALLQDLKEFENVFEETKLKFEKEKQLNVGEVDGGLTPVVNIESVVPTPPPPPPPLPSPQPQPLVAAIPNFECEKVVVGVKRKPEVEIPVVARLYTTAKKPLIVVANYGQPAPAQVQVQTRPVATQVSSSSPPSAPNLPTKSPRGKSRSGKTNPNPAKSPPTAKPQQKPQEDEKTQQKIFAILEEYAVQKEHSPDTNNRPAPRRRSHPSSASASKKKRTLVKSKDASGDSEDGSFSEM